MKGVIGVIGVGAAEIADSEDSGNRETVRVVEERGIRTSQKKCMLIKTLVRCLTTRLKQSKSSSNKNKVKCVSLRTLHPSIGRTSGSWVGKLQKQD